MSAARLFVGRSVLTGRLDQPEVPDGGVVVDGATILAVGLAADLRRSHPDARELGGDGYAVIPGLVSAHQHGAGASSVQLGCPDQPFEGWLAAMFGIPPLDMRLDTTYHALRLLENGITSTIHSHYTRDPTRYESEVDEILAAYATAGMRVGFAPCYLDRNLLTYGEDEAFLASLPAEIRLAAGSITGAGIAADDYVPFVLGLREARSSDRCRVLFGPVAPQWCSPGVLAAIGRAVADGIGAQLHLLESAAQRAYLDASLGRSVVDWLDELGFLAPATSFAHGVHLRDPEIELLARRGATVVLNPGCNLRLGNGLAPIGRLHAVGVPVAIGTDDMTIDDDDDLLGETRLVRAIARSQGGAVTAAEALAFATSGGARALGWEAMIGTIEAGKRADLVLLDLARLDEPGLAQDVSVLELVVARARGRDVQMVLVDGEVVVDAGRHVAIDRTDAISRLRAVVREQDSDPARRAFDQAMRQAAVARAAWGSRQVPNG